MSLKITPNDHVLGCAKATIEIIEYADFQCPYCRKSYFILKAIRQELGEKLRYVFRNFPLSDLHPHAVHAAIAAESAAPQNAFWEMHDMIFENQRQLDVHHLLEYAQDIGLDMHRFEKDFRNEYFAQKVKFDYETGLLHGVDSTPTFFINGELYRGNWMDASLLHHLKSLL